MQGTAIFSIFFKFEFWVWYQTYIILLPGLTSFLKIETYQEKSYREKCTYIDLNYFETYRWFSRNKIWTNCYYKRHMLKSSKVLLFLSILVSNFMLFWNNQVVSVPFLMGNLCYSNNVGGYLLEACPDGSSMWSRFQFYWIFFILKRGIRRNKGSIPPIIQADKSSLHTYIVH